MCIKSKIKIFIIYLWIIFILPIYNFFEYIIIGKGTTNTSPESICVISLMLAAFIEEFFFRKWLFGLLLYNMQLKMSYAMLVTNVIFAAYHLCNIFSYASVIYGIIQSIVAFSFGMAMSAIYRERDDLVVCIFAHLLVNISSIFNISTDVSGKYVLQGYQIIALCIISCVYMFYSMRSLNSVH